MNAKGTKDINVEEMIARNEIVSTIVRIFEKYGFNPLETPILERYEVLASKYAGGEDIVKEIFKLKDQAKRELGLRFDLTVPLARFIVMNPNLRMPFKRYQIGEVFRDEPVSSNRFREFIQCDVDTIGSNNMMMDAEIIALTDEIFKELGFKFEIRVNNRKILDSILDELEIKNKEDVLRSLDKLSKYGKEEVVKELKNKKIKNVDKIFELINNKNLKLKNKESLNELNEVVKYSKLLGVKSLKVDYSLARGLNYYTGTVFEVYIKGVKEAMAAGGRYDNLIKSLGKKNYPAVGISFGLSRIYNNYKKDKKSVVEAYVIPINTLEESLKIVKKLRDKGIKLDMDFSGRSISKNLDYVNKMNIPYVVFVGEKERKLKKIKLKDMKTGKERLVKVESVKI